MMKFGSARSSATNYQKIIKQQSKKVNNTRIVFMVAGLPSHKKFFFSAWGGKWWSFFMSQTLKQVLAL